MPTARSLLRLYPRAWRNHYGEEFVAIVGEGRLGGWQVVDVVSGAIDAWFSADVRNASKVPGMVPNEGGSKMLRSMRLCDRSRSRLTKRDGLIGAGVMIGASLLFLALGIAARREGWSLTSQIVRDLAFPVSFALSMPFWMMKGQSWKAQAVIVGGTVAFLIGIGYLATKI